MNHKNLPEATSAPLFSCLPLPLSEYTVLTKGISKKVFPSSQQQNIISKDISLLGRKDRSDIKGAQDSSSGPIGTIIEMFDSPVLWSNEFQITSDSLKFLIYKGKINRMFLRSKPMIIAQEDSFQLYMN